MEWISVNHRLPEKHQDVLTWDGYYTYLEDLDDTIDGIAFFSQSGSSCTHWHPLPKPPELNNNE